VWIPVSLLNPAAEVAEKGPEIEVAKVLYFPLKSIILDNDVKL
jgi:hypothetical protein